MIELTNMAVREAKDLVYDSKTVVYPFKLYFMNTKKTMYAFKKPEREMWINSICKALGYLNIENMYTVQVNSH